MSTLARRHGNTVPEAEDAIDLGPLPNLIGYAIRRAQVAMFQDFHRSLAPLDLRPAEFSILLLVARNPGLRQRRIGDALGIQPSNFAVLIDRLAARGVIERRDNPRDRRSVTLHLTTSGDTVLADATVLVERHDREATAAMSAADRMRLLALLQAIPR